MTQLALANASSPEHSSDTPASPTRTSSGETSDDVASSVSTMRRHKKGSHHKGSRVVVGQRLDAKRAARFESTAVSRKNSKVRVLLF